MNDGGSRLGYSGEIPVGVLSRDRPGLLRDDPLADLLNGKSDFNRHPLVHSGGFNPASSTRRSLSRQGVAG